MLTDRTGCTDFFACAIGAIREQYLFIVYEPLL